MLTMARQMEIYQEMSTLSARMVDAARKQDWETLVALEKTVSSLRDTLMADDDGNAAMSREDKAMKAAVIQRILDDDAEIRRHTEPWMEHVRQFLGSASQRRKVERAYGVTG